MGENTVKGSRVALVPCRSYDRDEVKTAVGKAIRLLGGFDEIFAKGTPAQSAGVPERPAITKESLLVLKPNLLTKTPPEKACTTHPAVFEATGALLQEAGYWNLKYGDSPGNPVVKPEKVAEECGIKAAADRLGIPVGDFEHGTQVDFKQGRTAKKFILCNEVIEADGIINVCKMKTHQLERITGAVKNIFGCVCGANKAASHAIYPNAETFGRMMADLNELVDAKLHIMDGITAMEGNGPQAGTPTAMNVILASADPVALDGLFCHLVNLRPELVPTNVSAMEQGLGSYEDIEVVTEDGIITAQRAAELYGNPEFNVQRAAEFRGALNKVKFLAPLLEKKPIIKKEKCIGCGICVRACPVEGKAIHVVGDRGCAVQSAGRAGEKCGTGAKAQYDYDKCIKCYCCQEMCPEEAITVKKSLLARIADRQWKL